MKMYKLILALLFISVLKIAYPHAGGHYHERKDYKEWTLKDGTNVKGVFSLVKSGKVYLETPDFKLVSYDIATLSDLDRKYVEEKIVEINTINAPLKHHDHAHHNDSVQLQETNDLGATKGKILLLWIVGIISSIVFFVLALRKYLSKKISILESFMLVIAGSMAITSFVSCKKKGCTDPLASNYYSKANVNQTCY